MRMNVVCGYDRLMKTFLRGFLTFCRNYIILLWCFIVAVTFNSNVHRSNDLTTFAMHWSAGDKTLIFISIERCDYFWWSKTTD